MDLYSRKIDYDTASGATRTIGYSEVREGSNASLGWLVRNFTRVYLNYTWETTNVAISDEFRKGISVTDVDGAPIFNPYADAGRSIDSRLTPTFVRNTVDHPIFPHQGTRLTASIAMAGHALRGSFDYLKPNLEFIWYLPTSRRTGFGLRGEAGWLRTYGSTRELPYYLRYFLGGEYQIRGVDIRSVGPVNKDGYAIGGNKFALFNAEYYIDLFGPLRLVLFHDAGQAYSEDERMDLTRLRTSSGVELRFFMPVLNVPFRLIWSANTYRDPWQPASSFKFSVGTTF
jgi:outer membrane protein assembly factor BamA